MHTIRFVRVSRLAGLTDVQCDPPDRPVIVPKHRTPMQLYIRHLFYNALTRNSSDKILKLVRKLDWADKNVRVSSNEGTC